MNKTALLDVYAEAKEFFSNAKASHAYDHTERVLRLCLHIGKIEGANLEVLELSALLHDICRQEEMDSKGKICHAEKGAILAREILKRHNYPNETINSVSHAIETHRNKTSKKPLTLEAKILFDSDKIDALGAVGLGRLFMGAQEIGAKLHNEKGVDMEKVKEFSEDDTAYYYYYSRLRKAIEKLYTAEGKRIAKERLEYMQDFFKRLNEEIDGKI
jgi:uncharacterized protein